VEVEVEVEVERQKVTRLVIHLEETKVGALLQTTQQQATRLLIATFQTHQALACGDLTAGLLLTITVSAMFLNVAQTRVTPRHRAV